MQGLNIIQFPDGRFCLTVMEPGGSEQNYWKLFEQRRLQGGGYTWRGIIESLVQIRMESALHQLDIEAEADNAYVTCRDRQVLELLGLLIEEAIGNDDLLTNAIDSAEDLE